MAVKFDIRKFFVNHCEKLVAGIIAVLTLWSLAQASWRHAEERPEELIINADNVQDDIERNVNWPESERERFVIDRSISKLAGELGKRDDLDIEKFAMRNPWLEPLNPLQEKRQNVPVLPPESPEISGFTVALAFPVDEEEGNAEGSEKNEDDTEGDEELSEEEQRILDEFGGGAGGAARAGQPAALQMRGLFGFGDRDAREEEEKESRRSRGNGIARGDRRDRDNEVADDVRTTGARKVEWRAGVSVRMVVNLRKQRIAIAKALHLDGSDIAGVQRYLDYKEIHIERQEYSHGKWSEWERVRLGDLVEVLDETLGSDVDIVNPAVTRSVITMPLPRRAAGNWIPGQASHSRLENFELDPDERDMINRIVAITAQKAAEVAEEEESLTPDRGGFGSHIKDEVDLRLTARRGFRNEEELNNSIRKIVQESFGEDNGQFTERQKEIFDQQISQLSNDELDGTDRLLLVRFMDFTADRGMTYRYRVRLEMFNPNFGQLVDTLESPEIASKQSLVSDWSEVTEPVTVPMRYRNYARSVKRSPSELKSMRVDVGVYYEGDGILPVIGSAEVDMGLPIGGKTTTERVDLEKTVLEKGDVRISTDEILCGMASNPRLVASEHSDFEDELINLPRGTVPAPDVVCVIDQNGDMVLRDVDRKSRAFSSEENLVSRILSNYESWRGGGNVGAFGLDDDDDRERGGRRGRRERDLGMSEGNVLSTNSGSRRGRRGR